MLGRDLFSDAHTFNSILLDSPQGAPPPAAPTHGSSFNSILLDSPIRARASRSGMTGFQLYFVRFSPMLTPSSMTSVSSARYFQLYFVRFPPSFVTTASTMDASLSTLFC